MLSLGIVFGREGIEACDGAEDHVQCVYRERRDPFCNEDAATMTLGRSSSFNLRTAPDLSVSASFVFLRCSACDSLVIGLGSLLVSADKGGLQPLHQPSLRVVITVGVSLCGLNGPVACELLNIPQ